MKRRNKIGWLTLALSLSFGTCAAAFLGTANDVKQVNAADDPIFKIGSQDMLTTPSYNTGSYSGTAVLDSSGSEYVLTLDNFDLSVDGPYQPDTTNSYVLLTANLTKNVKINLKGTNSLTNTKVSGPSLACIGFQGSTSGTFTIQTDPSEGSTASLSVYCEGTGGSYNRGITSSTNKRVIFNNCIINADGGPASGVSNGIGLFGGATVNDGAVITATGASGATESYGFKVANNTFYMNGGTVNGIGGDATKYSYGVAVSATTQSGGKLTGTAGTATSNDSVGVALFSTYTLNDGEVYADSPASSNSYGFAPQSSHGSTVQLSIGSSAKRLASSGNTKAINCDLVNNYPGLGWDNALGTGDSETIETSAEARTIDYLRADFRRMTYTATANPAVDYDGSSHAAVSVSVTEPASGYTIGYKLSEDSEYSSSVPSFTEAGTYSIDYKISASGYADRTGTLSFTINPLDAAIATHPTLASDFTYDGTFHSLLATNGSASSGAMYYRVGSGGGWYTDIPEGKNAGNYTVYYKAGGPNYNETASYNLGTVRILDAEITNVSISQSGTLTYNGSAQTPSVSASCTTVNSQPATYTYSDEYSAIESDYGAMPSFTSAGDHTVYYCITAPNHDSKMGSFVVTIQKANSSVIEAPSIKTGLVYNNTSQELINAGTASGGTMVYRLGSYGWFDAAIPEVAAAGSYDVYYKVMGDGNHNDSAEQLLGSAVIAPATITNISVSATNETYTGSAITPSVSASATTVGSLAPTFTYSTTSDGVYGDLPSFTSVGDHTVYYKVNAANHSEASGSFTFTINKADAAFVAPTAISGLVVTGSDLTLINAGTSSTGTLVYRLGETGEFSTTLPAVTEAGTYTIYYMVLGDENHNDSEIQSIVVIVAPAPSGDTPSDPPAPEPGTSEPGTSVPGTSEPGTPTNSEPKSFPVWAAVVIPVGGILLVFGLLLLLFFFALNKWVIHNGKPVRVYKIGKKDDKVKLLTLGFKVILKDESEIFDSKADALKLLK